MKREPCQRCGIPIDADGRDQWRGRHPGKACDRRVAYVEKQKALGEEILGPHEQDRSHQSAHWQKKADKINAEREQKERDANPLFIDVHPPEYTDREAEYWRWRFNVAAGVERGAQAGLGFIGMVGLGCIREQAMERWARQLIGHEATDALRAYCRLTYPNVDYRQTFWCKVLTTTERIVFAFDVVVDPEYAKKYPLSGGRRLVERGAWPPEGHVPPLTREQWYERFPPQREEPEPTDDGGLAELFARVFERKVIEA